MHYAGKIAYQEIARNRPFEAVDVDIMPKSGIQVTVRGNAGGILGDHAYIELLLKILKGEHRTAFASALVAVVADCPDYKSHGRYLRIQKSTLLLDETAGARIAAVPLWSLPTDYCNSIEAGPFDRRELDRPELFVIGAIHLTFRYLLNEKECPDSYDAVKNIIVEYSPEGDPCSHYALCEQE
jgi:hypothetical protein